MTMIGARPTPAFCSSGSSTTSPTAPTNCESEPPTPTMESSTTSALATRRR